MIISETLVIIISIFIGFSVIILLLSKILADVLRIFAILLMVFGIGWGVSLLGAFINYMLHGETFNLEMLIRFPVSYYDNYLIQGGGMFWVGAMGLVTWFIIAHAGWSWFLINLYQGIFAEIEQKKYWVTLTLPLSYGTLLYFGRGAPHLNGLIYRNGLIPLYNKIVWVIGRYNSIFISIGLLFMIIPLSIVLIAVLSEAPTVSPDSSQSEESSFTPEPKIQESKQETPSYLESLLSQLPEVKKGYVDSFVSPLNVEKRILSLEKVKQLMENKGGIKEGDHINVNIQKKKGELYRLKKGYYLLLNKGDEK